MISSSETMRPAAVSIRNILPGCSRPLATISADGTSSTPLSLARMTRSSMVRHQRPGRNPLRSNTAPTSVPSVKVTQAGPSHGSISEAWNCQNARSRGVHGGVVLPRLGDHHQHGVRQAAAAEVQQFEHLVERRRVGCLRRADRREPAQVAGDLRAGQHGLAGVHPVAVAAHGVDLAVVRDEAERMRQRPGREGVGGEAAVHDRDGADAAFVAQIRKVLGQLHCREHALVDHGPAGQRREVHVRRARRACAADRRGDRGRYRRACVPVRRRTTAPCAACSRAPSRRPRRRRGRRAPRASRGRRALFAAMASTRFASGGAGDGVLRQEADAGGEGVGAVGGRAAAVRSRRPRAAVRRAAGSGCRRRHRCWVRRRRRRGVRGAPGRPVRRRRWRASGGPGCRRSWRRRRSPTRCSGSYRPWASGNAENSIGGTSAVRENLSGTAPARIVECISAAAELPVEKRRDQREPGQLRTTVQAIAATAMMTIGGHRHQPLAAAPAHQKPCQPAAAGRRGGRRCRRRRRRSRRAECRGSSAGRRSPGSSSPSAP